MSLLNRPLYLGQIKKHFRIQPICAILGARQVGKTTLARQFAAEHPEKNRDQGAAGAVS